MKNCFSIVILALATTVALATDAAPPAKTAAAPSQNKAAAQETPVPKSSFGIPAKAQDGRDPFFPASDRLFAVKSAPPKPAAPPIGTELVCNGKAGRPGHPLAMINSKTFAEGEDGWVNTANERVHVLCVEIKDDVIVIEVAGNRRELRFQDR